MPYQVQDTSRGGLLLGVLGVVEEALASLRRPGGGRVGNLGLLAAKVVGELVRRYGLLAQPEVLLGELEAPVKWSAWLTW